MKPDGKYKTVTKNSIPKLRSRKFESSISFSTTAHSPFSLDPYARPKSDWLLNDSILAGPQVWFQNARAKWRRNMMRQEGNTTVSNVGCPGTPVPSNTGGSPNVGPSASILGDSNSMPSTSMEELHALHHLHSGVSSQVSFSDLY